MEGKNSFRKKNNKIEKGNKKGILRWGWWVSEWITLSWSLDFTINSKSMCVVLSGRTWFLLHYLPWFRHILTLWIQTTILNSDFFFSFFKSLWPLQHSILNINRTLLYNFRSSKVRQKQKDKKRNQIITLVEKSSDSRVRYFPVKFAYQNYIQCCRNFS